MKSRRTQIPPALFCDNDIDAAEVIRQVSAYFGLFSLYTFKC